MGFSGLGLCGLWLQVVCQAAQKSAHASIVPTHLEASLTRDKLPSGQYGMKEWILIVDTKGKGLIIAFFPIP